MESKENPLNSLKEFLRPTKRKIVIFSILLFCSVLSFLFVGYPYGSGIIYISPFHLFLLSSVENISGVSILFFIYLFSALVEKFCILITGIKNPLIKIVSTIIIFSIIFIIFIPHICSYYYNPPSPLTEGWDFGCEKLKNDYNCDLNYISQIDARIDITGDGIDDSLLVICRGNFNEWNATKYFCRNKCCNMPISEDLDCEQDMDCTSAVGGEDWKCDAGIHKCRK